jgi:hypothetical protein
VAQSGSPLANASTACMQIESQVGLIDLPLEQLVNPAGKEVYMNDWTQKMRDTFHSMAGRAREAGKAAYVRASESYSRLASVVRQGATQTALLHLLQAACIMRRALCITHYLHAWASQLLEAPCITQRAQCSKHDQLHAYRAAGAACVSNGPARHHASPACMR